MHKQITNLKPEYAKYSKALKKLPLDVHSKWTNQQKNRFNKAVLKHGKDRKALMKYFPKKSYNQIGGHFQHLKRQIEADKTHPDAHLKKTLQKVNPHLWTKKEETTFIKMCKKHGKNYKLI